MYETIIIGGGPAGLAAGLYLARKKVRVLLISKNIGGQVLDTAEVENYLGFKSIIGSDLAAVFSAHIKQYKDAEIKEGLEVKEIKKLENNFLVIDEKGGEYPAKSVILTMGKIPRKLNVLGEEKFQKKGITYCATCDAPLFADKNVAVVGGGNSGFEAALQLIKYAKKIYLLEISDKIRADKIVVEKVKASGKVEILLKTKISEILGDQFVKRIKINQDGKEKFLDIDGVFVEIGLFPATKIVEKLVKLNKWKEVIVDSENKTSCEGIFAAGDLTEVKDKQIIIAAGDGARAALACYQYLSSL